MPSFARPARGPRADAPDAVTGRSPIVVIHVAARQAGHASRLGEPGRRLRLQPASRRCRRRTSGRSRRSTVRFTARASASGSSVCAPRNASSQPHTSTTTGNDRSVRHHARRRRVVGGPVRRQEHRVRTQPRRRAEGMPERTPNARASYDAVATTCRGRLGSPSPPTTTGRPASSGRRRTSTAARNWSRSTCRTQSPIGHAISGSGRRT